MAGSGVPAATGLTPLRGGIVVLAAALCLPQAGRYRPIRWIFMGYTALTIVLWIVLGWPYAAIGYIDKVIEIALLGLLGVDHRRSSHDPRADAVRAV